MARMERESENPLAPETVSLQSAVLCVDCELVTSSRSNRCPVCGGHSLLDLAGIIGGRLLDYKGGVSHSQQLFLFDLHITIDMSQMEAGELSATIDSISGLIAPKLGRNRASLHVNVEPVSSSVPVKLKAA
jgi:hypothetical protein